MKRVYTLLYIIVAMLLSALMPQTATAQTQDAMYIFRNDGKFHFFYFGEVNGMDYSPLDTLGVIHDDFVTMELIAAGNEYRIPLSAIDSISFVTPEDKIKEDVKVCNELVNYIIASDGEWYILLDSNTPTELIPSVGDKILMDNPVPDPDKWWTANFIPDGFGGRVVLSEFTTDPSWYGWLIVTESTPITDMYDWLVIKEAASNMPPETSNSPQYGMPDDRPVGGLEGISVEVPEQDIQIPDFSNTFYLNHSTISTPDGGPLSISADLTGSIGVIMSQKLKYRGCLFVSPWTGINFDQRTVWETDKIIGASVSGTLNGRFEVGFSKNTKKTKIGKLNVELGAGLFVEASMTGFEFSLHKETKTRTTTNMSFDNSSFKPGLGGATFDPSYRWHTDVLQDTIEVGSNLPTAVGGLVLPNQMSFGIGAYIKAETKLGLPLEKTKALPAFIQERLKKYADNDTIGFKASLGFDIGAKIDLKCPWQALLTNPTTVKESQNCYKDLRDNGSVQLKGYLKGNGEIKLGKWKVGDTKEYDWPADPRYFAPDISGINVRVDPDEKPEKPYIIRFTSPVSRKMFALTGGANIGFTVLDENQQVVDEQCDLPWSGPEMFDKDIKYFQKGTYYNTFKLDPGKGKPVKYTVYPIMSTCGKTFLVDREKTFTLEAARFNISQRNVKLGEKGGYVQGEYVGIYEIEVVPNMENVEVKTDADWLSSLSWLGKENLLSFHWDDLPEGMRQRRAVIYLTGLSQKGEELVKDSVVVTQACAYMILEPEKLSFPKEGGTKTVTIKETNLTNLVLKIPASSPEIHGTLSGNTVIITMDANTEPSKRGNMVRIEGKTVDGDIAYGAFDVEQEGTGEDPGPGPGPNTGDFEIQEIELDKYLFGEGTGGDEGKIFTFGNWETKTIDDYNEYGIWWNVNDNAEISVVKNAAGGYSISATKTVVSQEDWEPKPNTTVTEISFDVAEVKWEWDDSDEVYYITANGLTNLKASYVWDRYGSDTFTERFEIASLADPNNTYYSWTNPLKTTFGSYDVYVDNFFYEAVENSTGRIMQKCTTYNGKYNVSGTDVENYCFVKITFKPKTQ